MATSPAVIDDRYPIAEGADGARIPNNGRPDRFRETLPPPLSRLRRAPPMRRARMTPAAPSC